MQIATVDGVKLELRTGNDPGRLARFVHAIHAKYDGSAGLVVARLYEDDKNCAFYEVELADDIPLPLARMFAEELIDIFRGQGGYNGIQIRQGESVVASDDCWWDEPWLDEIIG